MKILMVCLGNICRSPLAEGIMRHLIKEEHPDWEVDSAGTGNWHVGEGPDRRSTRVAQKYGVDISQQVCRQFKRSDFDEFDLILVMDRNNLSDVVCMAPTEHAASKVRLLLGEEEVPDPYYNDAHFEPVYKLIEQGCRKLLEEFERSH